MKADKTTPVWSRAVVACLFAALAAVVTAHAGEVAVLRNGFSIRHEHRAVVGTNTRLYLDGGTASYVDIPTANIEGFKRDFTPAAAALASSARRATTASAQPAPDLNQVVNSASANFHLDPDLVNSVIHA